MVATLELLELQLTARPVRTELLASRVVAVAWVVWPGLSVLVANSTLVDATGVDATGSTVSAASPRRPALVAVTTVAPAANVVIWALFPLPVIEATAGSLTDHVTGCPLTLKPVSSRSVATADNVCPTVDLVAVNATVTDWISGPVTRRAQESTTTTIPAISDLAARR
jgi:hypothetical protein